MRYNCSSTDQFSVGECLSLRQIFLFMKLGDVVCDPMCGGASIGLEGALAFPESFHISGDNHEKAVDNAGENYAGIETLHKNNEGEGYVIKGVFRTLPNI